MSIEATLRASTESPMRLWAKALDDADTLERVKALVAEWEPYCGESYDLVSAWSEQDFREFRAVLAAERQKVYTGDQRFLDVIFGGEALFAIGCIAIEHDLPFLYVRDRLLQSGMLHKDGNRYRRVEAA